MIMEPTMIPSIGMISMQDWTYHNWKKKKWKGDHAFTEKDIENIVRKWLFDTGKLKGPLSGELSFRWKKAGNILEVKEENNLTK